MRRIMLALAAFVWLAVSAPAAAAAPTLTLAQVAAAAERQDVAVLNRALADPKLLASLEAMDPEAAIALRISIAEALQKSGDRVGAISGYRSAIEAIGRARQGHDDLAQVDLYRRIAALEFQDGKLAAAVVDIDRALGIATAAKHPSLLEVKAENAAIRAALLKSNPGAILPEPYLARGGDAGRYDLVELFYATHRQPSGAVEPAAFFGGERGPLVFGKALVSVPRDRAVGELPRPSIWRMEFRPDPNRHVVLTQVAPLADGEAFFAEVSRRVAGSGRKEVFVFIHGFNTSFEGAAVRTAQLAADLAIDGAPILYSWPSKGSMLAYFADEKEPKYEPQIRDLEQFLADVAQRTGAARVHLIAHSMGNRFLVAALGRLSQRPAATRPAFDEVVMAAPDVGVDSFRSAWPSLRPLSRRFTLYASKRDKALLVSGQLHGMQRVGDARKIVVADGLQTVDTTAASQGLLGHADFAGSALDDFRGVIWYSLAPNKRCVLQTDKAGGLTFWVFAAAGACPEEEFREAVSLVRTKGSPSAAIAAVQSMITETGKVSAGSSDVRLLEKVRALLIRAFDQPVDATH